MRHAIALMSQAEPTQESIDFATERAPHGATFAVRRGSDDGYVTWCIFGSDSLPAKLEPLAIELAARFGVAYLLSYDERREAYWAYAWDTSGRLASEFTIRNDDESDDDFIAECCECTAEELHGLVRPLILDA